MKISEIDVHNMTPEQIRFVREEWKKSGKFPQDSADGGQYPEYLYEFMFAIEELKK